MPIIQIEVPDDDCSRCPVISYEEPRCLLFGKLLILYQYKYKRCKECIEAEK